MKQCFKCQKTLPIDCFYKHPQMADGHLGKCKECTKRDVKERYALTIAERHAYEKKRNSTEERKAAIKASLARQRATNPEKSRARARVSYAVRTGKLVRPMCHACGQAIAQGHHEDYSKPLDVEWLCFKCHREHHGQTVTSDYR